jgi:hypothetical protein
MYISNRGGKSGSQNYTFHNMLGVRLCKAKKVWEVKEMRPKKIKKSLTIRFLRHP